MRETTENVYWLFTDIVPENTEITKKQKLAKLTELIKTLENNTLNKHPRVKAILEKCNYDLKTLWTNLQITSLKLQTISFKQINNIPLVESEKNFIGDYGKILAKIMLYKGNSYFSPSDDSPKIIDVFTVINKNNLSYLEVGVARPREILVLYPTPKGKVLCKGAVMPYYEFFNNTRLNDKEWKIMIGDKNKHQKIPSWLAPIVKNGKL